jgi:phosphatidylserine/phosphatidylglycerophosphate/cardiolipin synthase-like enzyme
MRPIQTFLYVIILVLCPKAFSQLVVEKDFNVVYSEGQLTLKFNSPETAQNITVTDLKTNAAIPLEANRITNSFELKHLHPAQMLKVDYATSENGQNISHSKFLVTPSTSSGTINVWFNHEVNTAYSQGHDAVNLGNALDDKLISYINACQNTLDMAIYNSYSPSATTGIAGAINAAYTRGVQIRLVYDGSTGSAMIPLLNPAIPVLASPTSSSYGIMHNKFVVFDADNADANVPLVWTGSTNWTVAQIDGPDRNSVILIQDQALAQVYKTEFQEMWGSSGATPDLLVSKFGPFKTDNTPHHLIVGGKAIDVYFSPTDSANTQIIAAINSANTDIDIATMLITRTDIRTALTNKYDSGMTNINIVTDSQNPASNQFATLQTALLPNHVVKFTDSGIMHHKFMVVDNYNLASDPLVTVGSHNWSSSAETKNDENMLVVHDPAVADQYYQAFAYLYLLAGGVITPLAVDTNEAISGYVLYPNPSNGIYTLENKSGIALDNASITVCDILGKTIYTSQFNSLSSAVIDLTAQANGMYFVEIKGGNKSLHFKALKN